ITADAVLMGTDTTGSFVQRIVAGDGIATTGASMYENVTHTLSVDLASADVGGATGSFSGLEFVNSELSMLQGCADNQLLAWDDTAGRWQCVSDNEMSSTLQNVYDNDDDTGDVLLTLSGTDDAVIFRNPNVDGIDSSGTLFMLSQMDTSGITALHVSSNVTDDHAMQITTSGTDTTDVSAGLYVETTDAGGALYIHRNVAGSTTIGSLVLIHEEETTADTDVFALINEGLGDSFRVSDESTDSTPFVIDNNGNVSIGTTTVSATLTVGGSAYVSDDLTIAGDDIRMGTNTASFILIADGSEFSPVAVTGDGTFSTTGTFTITADAVLMGTDTTGSFVQRIVAGDGIATTGASMYENVTHTLSVDLA
ncbi:MAG: hypothetical protein R3330_18190, partial [Saprospiraceae bacterium]|nr:hypothetical protein [Saprospiraceae bacterium]